MEDARFEAKKLKVINHVRDQDTVVRDPDKARLMANEESKHADLARLYEDYRSDPQVFLANHPTLDRQRLEALNRLEEKKVPPEYIRRYGQLRAEIEGELYDFKHRICIFCESDLLALKQRLGLSVETAILLGSVAKSEKRQEYERTTNQMNDWLMLCADAMKLEAIEGEIYKRLQHRN